MQRFSPKLSLSRSTFRPLVKFFSTRRLPIFPGTWELGLTSGYDVEHAGLLLLPDGVAAPAHERAVLERPRGREREHRHGAVGPDEALLHLTAAAAEEDAQKWIIPGENRYFGAKWNVSH